MEQNTKEWYEAVEFFERTVSSYGTGSYRFDKETNAPVGHWYQHGETNDAFRMFIYGLAYGERIAALETVEGDLQQTHNRQIMPCSCNPVPASLCLRRQLYVDDNCPQHGRTA